MQHPHPEDAYPEFPLQLQSLHPHAHDLQQWEIGADYADQPTTASAAWNPYSLPMVMDPRFLQVANSASALSQHCAPYPGLAPSGLLTGIAHHLVVGLAQGNNYIGVLNIESPTCPRQSKK